VSTSGGAPTGGSTSRGAPRHPSAPRLFHASKLPATLFLISKTAARNRHYFTELQDEGAQIEGHTFNHPYLGLKGRSAMVQHAELCNSAGQLDKVFGVTPRWFRPPYGTYDMTTLRMAKECGYQVQVMWEGSVIDGALRIARKKYGPHNPLRPGMILLMHFTQHFQRDYRTLLAAIRESGYSVGRLSDYLDQRRAPATGPYPSLIVPKAASAPTGRACPDVSAEKPSKVTAGAKASHAPTRKSL